MSKYFAAFLLFVLAPLTIRAADPAAAPQAPTASATPAVAWKECSYKEDLMAFSSPVDPKVSAQNADDGSNAQVHIYTVKAGGCVMLLTTSPVSAAAVAKYTPDGFMKSAQQGALESMNAKSTSEKKITIDNNPGYEYQFASAQIHGILRVYLAGGRIYQIGYITAIANPLPADGDRFLASFHLLKP